MKAPFTDYLFCPQLLVRYNNYCAKAHESRSKCILNTLTNCEKIAYKNLCEAFCKIRLRWCSVWFQRMVPLSEGLLIRSFMDLFSSC